MDSVYVETTVLSYLTARRSRDIVIAGRQAVTREWWERRRDAFALFISDLVLDEALQGDPDAAGRRAETAATIRVLSVDKEVESITALLVTSGIFPIRAATDAAHIAIATRHGIDYLPTWNCSHLANAEIIRNVSRLLSDHRFEAPTICIPAELMGESNDD